MDFDELHAVSDLHFGGTERQIFSGVAELPWLLRQLAARAGLDGGRRIAFVINGDFIDFLAEAPAAYFDAGGAIAKLRRVAADPSFSDSFAALGEFASTPHCTLAINLGNHDLELALPEVQHAFAQACRIAEPARLQWIVDGSGLRASVGGRSVLCLHGNEADLSNHVDFDFLRQVRRARQAGKPLEPARPDHWIPNAGTRLVIDAMNPIKQQHAFIDVLKPETEAAVRVLLAVDHERARSLAWPAFQAMALQRGRDQLASWFGLLGVEAEAAGRATAPIEPAEWLAGIEQDYRLGRRAGSQLPAVATLGAWDDLRLLWQGLRRQDPTVALRQALEALGRDRSFELEVAEPMNEALHGLVDTSVHFLLSGHTHFERSLSRGPLAHHYNTGTWAYLMQVTPALLADPPRFAAWLALLRREPAPDLAELARAGVLLQKLTVASIVAEPGASAAAPAASGCLQHVVAATAGSAGAFALARLAASVRRL